MRTSYKKEDVCILLKDITGMVEPEDTKTRERKIQSGTHYCEMLPKEYVPTKEYQSAFEEMMEIFSKPVADATAALAENIYMLDKKPVLISLARAGIPAGILLKRYLEKKYHIEVPHYAISIIRGKGIDDNAMKYILERHSGEHFIFIDGWTGKGAIKNQLDEALRHYDCRKTFAVIADPAHVADVYGTKEDLMIPSACLNSTVSGLISRTFLRDDVIGPDDFHGALYYEEMKDNDQSYYFIESIEKFFELDSDTGLDEVQRIQKEYHINDINLVKPGIGESTRVLLRRVPDMILINQNDKDSVDLKPIYRLCEEKNVPIHYCDLTHYKVCGIIKDLADA